MAWYFWLFLALALLWVVGTFWAYVGPTPTGAVAQAVP